MKRLALIAAVFIVALTAGCDTAPKSRVSYTNSSPDDDAFARGANRPPTAETLYRMSRLLEAQGKDDQAYAALLNTIDRYPDYVPAYVGLASLQVRQRKVGPATTTLEQALAIAPNDPVVLNDMGMVWMLRGDNEKALGYFTQAAQQMPDDSRYHANMALATGMMGNYDEAYDMYLKTMRTARAHYNLSIIAEARNDMERANEEFAKARALDSTIERKPRSE